MAADPDYWYAKGQKDYLDQNYDPPIQGPNSFIGLYDEDDIANNDAYKVGWANARNQAD